MDVELAEVTGEALVGVPVEVLVPEDQHYPVVERAPDVLQLRLGERGGQVETMDLGADVGRDRAEREVLVLEVAFGRFASDDRHGRASS